MPTLSFVLPPTNLPQAPPFVKGELQMFGRNLKYLLICNKFLRFVEKILALFIAAMQHKRKRFGEIKAENAHDRPCVYGISARDKVHLVGHAVCKRCKFLDVLYAVQLYLSFRHKYRRLSFCLFYCSVLGALLPSRK